ncbi:MAG: hypothetical protein HQ567_03685, partial [Candidatus Nealsonbacteria bacterium]|nr:hypothetical protein [Candidatus Nealsonbacteria bacterium]
MVYATYQTREYSDFFYQGSVSCSDFSPLAALQSLDLVQAALAGGGYGSHGARRLRVEPLEQRQLLSVTATAYDPAMPDVPG